MKRKKDSPRIKNKLTIYTISTRYNSVNSKNSGSLLFLILINQLISAQRNLSDKKKLFIPVDFLIAISKILVSLPIRHI